MCDTGMEQWNKPVRLRDYDWEHRYLKPGDVVIHNKPDDCWITFNGLVLDITPIIQQHLDKPEVLPLLAVAGKDISQWFDSKGEIRTFVHPELGTRVPLLPHGPIPHLTDYNLPTTEWQPPPLKSWWKDSKYIIGRLTKNTRPIRIRNNLTKFIITLTVCAEDTLEQIVDRYIKYNEDARSYIWKYEGKKLDMKKTLEENGIPDRKAELRRLGLPEDIYVPVITIYYTDNFLRYDRERTPQDFDFFKYLSDPISAQSTYLLRYMSR